MARTTRSRWSLDKRLAGAFGTLIALTIALGVTAVGSSQILRHGASEMYNREMPALDSLVEADRDLQQLLVAERTMMNAEPGPPLFDKMLAAHAENLAQSDERWKRYRALARSPKEEAIVQAYEKARATWALSTARIIELRKQKTRASRKAALALSLGDAATQFNEMRESLNQAEELDLEISAANHARAEQTFRYASFAVLGGSLLAAIAGVLLWWRIGVRTSREVRVTAANQSIDQMVATMASVRESSQRVSKIIRTIDEIAFQTNILALNAAVEAARAGAAGQGFAVVADEVRNLAQRAAHAARDTTQLIEESMTRSTEGDASVRHVSQSIAGITAATGELTESLHGIHAAARQQAEGLGQGSTAVQQMGRVTQSIAANAEEGAAASEVLDAQAHEALESVLALESIVGTRPMLATRTVGRVARQAALAPASTVAAAPRRTGTHG